VAGVFFPRHFDRDELFLWVWVGKPTTGNGIPGDFSVPELGPVRAHATKNAHNGGDIAFGLVPLLVALLSDRHWCGNDQDPRGFLLDTKDVPAVPLRNAIYSEPAFVFLSFLAHANYKTS